MSNVMAKTWISLKVVFGVLFYISFLDKLHQDCYKYQRYDFYVCTLLMHFLIVSNRLKTSSTHNYLTQNVLSVNLWKLETSILFHKYCNQLKNFCVEINFNPKIGWLGDSIVFRFKICFDMSKNRFYYETILWMQYQKLHFTDFLSICCFRPM